MKIYNNIYLLYFFNTTIINYLITNFIFYHPISDKVHMHRQNMSLKSGENPNGMKHQMNIPEKRGKEQKIPIAY